MTRGSNPFQYGAYRGLLRAARERARAEATNRYYGLGTVDSKAVRARAQATDRFYGLDAKSQALQAEKRRSEAMNKAYHLGRYSVIHVSTAFDWTDAGIGAGALLGALLVAGGLAVVARRRFSSPSTI